MSYILTFDVGTTAVKANLINRQSGEMLSAKADVPLYCPSVGYAEQNPDEFWNALCQTSRDIAEKIDAKEIEGLVICAPWRHVIPLDGNYRPLSLGIIWADSRAKEQAALLNQRMGHFTENAQGYYSRLMWVKENRPNIWNSAAFIVGINDYLKYKVTGVLVTEPSDDFIHSPNPEIQVQYNQTLQAAGISQSDLDKFPKQKKCTDYVGVVTEQSALQMGLNAGIPVFGGFGDLPAISFGSGCTQSGVAHIYLGTSSWLCELLSRRDSAYGSSWFTANQDYQGALFGLTTGAQAYDWVIDRFYSAEHAEFGDRIYEKIEKEMAQVPCGCENLIVTHWLNGEHSPLAKNAKSVFFNVTNRHNRQHFVRAMLENICYSHRRSLNRYKDFHGCDPIRLNVVGGGAQSPLWMQIMTDVLKIPVHVPENPRYVGTFGAYYCALIGLGYEKDFNGLAAPEHERIFEPNLKNAAIYDEMFAINEEIYPSLKPLYDKINGVY